MFQLSEYQEAMVNAKLLEGETLFVVTRSGMGTTTALNIRAESNNGRILTHYNLNDKTDEVYLESRSFADYVKARTLHPGAKIVVTLSPENFTQSYAPKLKGVYKILTWPWDINPCLEEVNPRYKRTVIAQ